MTVNTSNTRIEYSGNGTTTVFAYNFKILDEDHLEVILVDVSGMETTLLIGTNYSVTSAGAPGGGTVILTTPPAVGESLVLKRAMPFTQGTDYTSGDAFPAETHEAALDGLVMNDQELREISGRCLKAPAQETGISEIPNVATRGTKLLSFSAGGVPEATSFSVADIETALLALTAGSGLGDTSTITHDRSGVDINLETFLNSRTGVNVQDWGVLPGSAYAQSNCDNYAALAAYIESRGGYANIIWPADDEPYEFSPKDVTAYSTVDNAWRIATELVDVEYCYHYGYGATVKVNADATWTRGNSNTGAGAVAIGCDESPIQFRASTAGACHHVGVVGLYLLTTATVAATGGASDGSTMGIAYKGCEDTITKDVTCKLWGTDGIYFGAAYGSAFGGDNHYVENPVCIANYRQGISIVGNDNGAIVGGHIKDTYGSSFGYAVDFEPNSADGRQSNWTITGLTTTNNERGACNHIRSQNITWIGCHFDEQRDLATNSGCIKIDGSADTATLTNAIKFIGCTIVGKSASVYLNGNYVDDVTFDNCTFKCTNDVSVSAQFRINAGTNANFGTVRIINSRIYGNGGLSARGATGGLDTKVIFENNEWYPSDENSTTQAWIFDTHSTFVEAIVKNNTIDFTKGTWSLTGTYQPYIPVGQFGGNVLESTSGYVVEWRDWGAGRVVEMGVNTWGTYSYYDGVVSALDIKAGKAGVQSLGMVGGDFGLPNRIVHGGITRVSNYASTPASFVGAQAPQDGDVTRNVANNQATRPQIAYTYESSLGGWMLTEFITLSGTTAARPPAASYDKGLQYLDTTLAANGQLITWNGTNWVDTAGTVV